MLKAAVLAALAVSTTAHAEGVIAAGGMAGFAPRSAIGGGEIEIGVPISGGWMAHAMAATGDATEVSILGSNSTSGTYSQLRAGFGYRYERKPGRRVEVGVDLGRQQVQWSGTDTDWLFGGTSDVSFQRTNFMAVPRVVTALGSADSTAELRLGVEAAFGPSSWVGADLTLGVGFRI
jgi:hypothetical protein